MAYGYLTEQYLAGLNSGMVFQSAEEWTPERYTSPFAERLSALVADFFDLPVGEGKLRALAQLIQDGAEAHGFAFSRTTLTAWLDGSRDPSVSSSDAQTRENIYRLAAALDFDLQLTAELFEKVFFTRAFNPKNLQELAWFFFARKALRDGEAGSSWYERGLRLCKTLEGESVTPGAPLLETRVIIDVTEYMDELAFMRFLRVNGASFSRDNENRAARERVKQYALYACKCVPGISTVRDVADIPWDTLIGAILDYSQRGAGTAGSVAGLRSLPPQLTTNFPTGQTLRLICSGRESSYDKIYKMFALLLFFCYFSRPSRCDGQAAFQGFLRFANLELDGVGFTELYPGQPYSGLLLFCAAQEKPLDALRAFLQEKIQAETESVQLDLLRPLLPAWGEEELCALIRTLGADASLLSLFGKTVAAFHLALMPDRLLKRLNKSGPEDAGEQLVDLLLEKAGFSPVQQDLLRLGSLLPPDGLDERFFSALLPENGSAEAEKLASLGWLSLEKGRWSQNHRLRREISGQLWAPHWENSAEFVRRFETLYTSPLPPLSRKQAAQLDSMARRLSALDGLPAGKARTLCERTAELLRPVDSHAADKLLVWAKKRA